MDGRFVRSGETKPATTYRDFVKFRQQNNPCVAGLSQFLETKGLPKDACRIYVLDCASESTLEVKPSGFVPVHVDNLHSVLKAPSISGQGRVIIIEDLHPSTVEILGTTLDIDPIFFADHVVTKYDSIEASPAPPLVALAPSQVVSHTDRINIHFQQIVDFGGEERFRDYPWTFKTTANMPRTVRRLPPLSGRQLGITRSCHSVLVKPVGRSWISKFRLHPRIEWSRASD